MKSVKDVNLYVVNKILFIVCCGLFVVSLFVLGGFTTTSADPENTNNTTYTLSYSAQEGGYLDGDCYQIVKEGKDGERVTAHANVGYEFDGWSDEVAGDVRIDKNIKANIKVVAMFKKIKTYN